MTFFQGEEMTKLNKEKSMKRVVVSTKVFAKKRKQTNGFGKPSKRFKMDRS